MLDHANESGKVGTFFCDTVYRLRKGMIDSMGQIKNCDKDVRTASAWRFPREGGFTLVELMVVIGIISIIAAIAYPNFLSWKPKYQVGSAARDLYSIFQKAKLESIKRREYCTVTFDTANNSYMAYVDIDKDFVYQAADDKVIATVSLTNYGPVGLDPSEGGGDGLDFTNPGDGIAFSPIGLPRNSLGGLASGTIYLKHSSPDRFAEVSISKSGSIHLYLDVK
jgi:prepilin-type N-terminal cleavage/methylation domain-containing protein